MDAQVLESKVSDLKVWFLNNTQLPEEIDEFLLRRFLKCMNYDAEKTKKVIEANYLMRNKYPHLFIERDPEDEAVKFYREATELVALPGLTKERYKVLLFRIVNLEPRQLNSAEEFKIFMMLCDSRFTMPDIEITDETQTNVFEQMADGDVQIVDLKGYTMSHMARISIFVFRTYMKFLQEAFPTRLRAMHVINCPSYLDKMVSFMRPFIRDEVFKIIHFHRDGLDSLYEHVPPHMLPVEYGGTAGTMSGLKEQWTKIFVEKRDYLRDEKQWKVEGLVKTGFWSWFS